ncbi:MscL family protein, partial [Faecalibacterium prausnitzii]|uniref:MscL family protein n=1 Tax=Faecalibacterium prausnitzii TaxID=853 RepID=UPI003AB0132F
VIGLGGSSIKIGEFVNSIINFLIVAFVLFVVIKFVNSLHKKPEAPAEPAGAHHQGVPLLPE